MKKFVLLTVLFLSLASTSAFAQKTNDNQRSRWMSEVRTHKFEFIAKEVGMTKEQQEAFTPLYNEMERAIVAVNREARELERKTAADANPTDTEYEAAALAIAKVKAKEGEIELEYFEKFAKILSKKQLFLLKRAENKFTQNILSQHRKAGKQ